MPASDPGSSSQHPPCQVNLAAPQKANSNNLNRHDKTLTVYCANYTSLSTIAQNTLFKKNAHIFCGVEHHKNIKYIHEVFNSHGFKVVATDPEPTDNIGIDASKSSGHGGELVAFKSNYKYKPIEQHILDAIHATTNAPLRFAAAVMQFKGLSIIFASIYLWDKEGLSERNQNLLFQIYLLLQTTQLPIFLYGDFNMNPNTLREAGWLDKLQVVEHHPPVPTTISTSNIPLLITF